MTARRFRPGPTPRSSCGSTSPALLRGRAVDGETCEIAGLGPIPVSVVQEWMENAFLAAIVTKGTEITKVVHLGRRFTSEQRTALQWRDPICARKGCDNRLGLEYDHFEDWADTRTTRVGAGRRFCPSCHRLKTARLERSPNPTPTASAPSPHLPPAIPLHRPARPLCTSSRKPPEQPSAPAEERSLDLSDLAGGFARPRCPARRARFSPPAGRAARSARPPRRCSSARARPAPGPP